MANINAPFGFRAVGHVQGLNWTDKLQIFCIRAADTAAYWIGDVVSPVADGDVKGIPVVHKILAGSEAAGIAAGVIAMIYPTIPNGNTFQGTPLSLENIPIPAGVKSHDWYVLVVTDPYVIFEAQVDSGSFATTEVNKNVSYAVLPGASTSLAPSGTVITNASAAVTATLPLRILGLSKDTSSNTYGPYARIRVRFNTHASFPGTAGV